jgi:hypothetical protein
MHWDKLTLTFYHQEVRYDALELFRLSPADYINKETIFINGRSFE